MKVLIDVSSKSVISKLSSTLSVKSSFQLCKSGASLRKLPFHLRLKNPSSVPLFEDVLSNLLILTLFECAMHCCVAPFRDVSAHSVFLLMVLFLILILFSLITK